MSVGDHKPPPVIEEIELMAATSKGEMTTVTSRGELAAATSNGEFVVVDDSAVFGDTRPSYIGHFIFIGTVLIPMAIAIVYLFFIASDRYASEASFIVRSVHDSSGAGAIAAVFRSTGLARADDATYAVNDYILSRDMVEQLVRHDHLRRIFSRPEADFINRFPNFYSRDDKESIYRHYQDFVKVWIDGTSGISTLQVTAFRPEDARALAAAILRHAEDLINRLNERAYEDSERYARVVVAAAQHHVDQAEAQLTAFRNKIGSVDPRRESAEFLDMMSKRMSHVASLEAQRRQLMDITPLNPALPALTDQIIAAREQIDRLRLRLVGGDHSLATKFGQFERLTLEEALAARELESADDNLSTAREAARQQHLYLERIVEPSVPDEPAYPRRILWSAVDLAACLAAFAIVRSLYGNIREHRA